MSNQIISSPRIFNPGPYKRVGIEDDHVPFMQRSMEKVTNVYLIYKVLTKL